MTDGAGTRVRFRYRQHCLSSHRARPSTLTWLDRNGRRTATLGDAGPYDQVVLSPRGRRATLVRLDTKDLWDVNLATGIFSRFTTDPAFDTDPSWAPDERALAFTSF